MLYLSLGECKTDSAKVYMRYATAKYTEYQKDKVYRIYSTDCLQAMAENTAKMVQKGRIVSKRFADLVYPQKKEEIDADDVLKSLIDKQGLVVIEN